MKKPPTPRQQAKIDHIMDHFDFSKVHKAMEALEWEWSNYSGVPGESDLRVRARALLIEALTKYDYVASGGFVAEHRDDDLSLSFQVESWSTSYGDIPDEEEA